MKGLHADTPVYFEKNSVYDIFADAEDAEHLVERTLIPHILGKKLLDFGCGSGKYSVLLAPYAHTIAAYDRSEDQRNLTRAHTEGVKNVTVYDSLSTLPGDADVAIACWVFGTIPENEREDTFHQLTQCIKPEGKILFVENDTTGEFEDIRGKTTHPDKPTERYNNWLIAKGCTVESQFSTHFSFDSTDEAQTVFTEIWGEGVGKKVRDKTIRHDVIIFSRQKNSL